MNFLSHFFKNKMFLQKKEIFIDPKNEKIRIVKPSRILFFSLAMSTAFVFYKIVRRKETELKIKVFEKKIN